MAQAVESVTPDALIEPLIRSGINVSRRLDRRVERCIEHRDLRNGLAENAPRSIDCMELEFVVRGSDFSFLLNRVANFGSNAGGLAQFPAMDDAMRDGIDGSRRRTQGRFEILVRVNMGLPYWNGWLRLLTGY